MNSLYGKRILVTGYTGFLGQHITEYLKNQNSHVLYPRNYIGGGRLERTDLLNFEIVKGLFKAANPDVVLHLAGYNGGISFNLENPADIFFRNTVMGLNVLEAAKQNKIKKVVSIVASCAYPEEQWIDIPQRGSYDFFEMKKCVDRQTCPEDEFFKGPIHDSVAPHGYAKRNLQLASKFYNQQYGLNAVCLCPTTLYGPGDTYDLSRTKVMGALVKKIVDAKQQNLPELVMYGSGAAKREFIYVKDAAQLICEAAPLYNDSSIPLNIGSGQEIQIKDLVELISKIVGYSGTIKWDISKPDGQLRKKLDSSKLENLLGESMKATFNFTSLKDGIKETIQDYGTRFIECDGNGTF